MVKIIKENGTDETDTCVYNKIDIINNSSVDFTYINVSPSFDLKIKDEISLLDYAQNKIFGGYIRNVSNNTIKETIALGYDVLLSDIQIQKNFENYSPEGIIQYCVEYAGLTYVSIISSGLTISLYPAKDKKLSVIMEDMFNILGSVGRIDNDKNYTHEYPGETFNGTALEIGKNCLLKSGWDLDTDNLCTQVKVIGSLENIQTEQLLSGDASTSEFEISNIFKTVKVEVNSGSGFVEQSPQISGVQTGDYEIQRELKKIIFQSGSIPPSGTDNILITYTYDREITYTEASEIIDTDKSNLHQKTIKKEYLNTIDDVESFASDYLNKFSTPLVSGIIKYDSLNINNFNINESIQVIDNTRKIDGNFVNKTLIIKRLVREFGNEGNSLLIHVSDNTEFSFNRGSEQMYRLKQLEENITTSELLQFGIKTTDSLTLQFDTTITSADKHTFASDTFYLEENSSGTRNQMKDDGTGDIMRETGYTSSSLTVTGTGITSSEYMNTARDDVFTELLTEITHIAVGDDNTTPVITDTTLGNQTYIESTTPTQTGLTLKSKIVMDITENNGNTVKEMGCFDAASSGNLILHGLTTVVDKDSSTEIRLSNLIDIQIINEDLS